MLYRIYADDLARLGSLGDLLHDPNFPLIPLLIPDNTDAIAFADPPFLPLPVHLLHAFHESQGHRSVRLGFVSDIPPRGQRSKMPVFSLSLPSRNEDLPSGCIVEFELVLLESAGVGGVLAFDDALAAGGLFVDLGGSFEKFLHGLKRSSGLKLG